METMISHQTSILFRLTVFKFEVPDLNRRDLQRISMSGWPYVMFQPFESSCRAGKSLLKW